MGGVNDNNEPEVFEEEEEEISETENDSKDVDFVDQTGLDFNNVSSSYL